MTMQEQVFGHEVAGATAASLPNSVRSLAASWPRPASAALAFAQEVGIARLGLLVGTAGVAVWLLGCSQHYLVELALQAPSWIALSIVIFVAASISSTVGFAFSAIAAAMIFHFSSDPVETVQIMMAASIGIQAYSVAGMWRTVSLRSLAPFVIGGVATMPLGIYLLLTLRPQVYLVTLGLALVLYGAYMLFRRPRCIKSGDSFLDIAVGAIGGVTGPLAALPGMFVVIWCGMRGWDKVVQRSVYQPYILILQVLTFCALSVVSGRSMLDEGLAAYALPGIAGAYLGLQLFQKLSDGQFHKLVNLALIVSGVALVLK
jgi:uncharacterized membrane protein YfcA